MLEVGPTSEDRSKSTCGPGEHTGSCTSRLDATRNRLDPLTKRVDHFSSEVASRRKRWYGRLIDNYLSDDADGLATFIAFNAMFAFMPVILTLALGLAILLSLVSSAEELAEDGFVVGLPEAIAEPVQQIMIQSSEGLLGVGIVTLVVLFWGGTRLYNSLDRAFARIYRTRRRAWVTRKLAGMIMVPAVAIIVMLTTVIVPIIIVLLLIPLGRLFDFVPGLGTYMIGAALLFAIGFLMMLVAYTAIPVHSPGLRSALPGAAVAAFLFMMLMFIFPLYQQFFGDYSLYGAVFGLILTMMFWFYLAAQIIVIGAEINAYREGRRAMIATEESENDELI